jgi:hypothetical protein
MKKKLALFAIPLILTMFLPVMAFTPPNEGIPPEGASWIMLKGEVTSYGGVPAMGWFRTYALIGEWAQVYAIVLPGLSFEPPTAPEIGNFTYSFIYVRLENSSIIALNYTGSDDLYVSGLWSVYNMTFAYQTYENFTLTIETITSNATGELLVTNTWSAFTINIEGVSTISGIVSHAIIGTVEIPHCDVDNNRVVDVFDLIRTAKAYGTTPGLECYNFELDFNFDFVIDIYDLLQISIELGKEY